MVLMKSPSSLTQVVIAFLAKNLAINVSVAAVSSSLKWRGKGMVFILEFPTNQFPYQIPSLAQMGHL